MYVPMDNEMKEKMKNDKLLQKLAKSYSLTPEQMIHKTENFAINRNKANEKSKLRKFFSKIRIKIKIDNKKMI